MRRQFLILITILLLFSPLAAAGWGAKGDAEPSTADDNTNGYMFKTPPQSASDVGKVYFNGWLSSAVGVLAPTANTNPNAATGDTGVFAPQTVRAWALLGVWKDCNKDGFIGLGDQGLWEYKVELLVVPTGSNPGICATGSTPATIPAYGWKPVHNDGKWVHEFLPLGWEEWRTTWSTRDPNNERFELKVSDDQTFDLNDSDARVWMDFGVPTSLNGGGTGCYINPQPRGTFHSTGGLVESADCFTIPNQFLVTDTLTSVGNAGVDAAVRGASGKDLSFKDKPRDQSNSTSILNVKNPWGEAKDPEYVQHWDCSQAQPVQVTDPTNGDWIINVSAPKVPSSPNPAGSPGGQVNSTSGGFDECTRYDDPGEGNGDAPYALEGDVVNSAFKVKPSDTLRYNEGFRRGGPLVTTLGQGTPRDLGLAMTGLEQCLVGTTNPFGNCGEGLWEGDTNYLTAYDPYVNDRTLSPSGVMRATFYAFVGSAAVSRNSLILPSTGGVYGSENCALPANRLFDCNRANWWPGDTMPRDGAVGRDPADINLPHRDQRAMPIGARVGDAYQLRDVDCWDHSVDALRQQGISYGTVTGTVCN